MPRILSSLIQGDFGGAHGNFEAVVLEGESLQVQDNMFGGFRDDEWAGEYGPYQITRYATGDRKISQIWFTMSTWNPYQSMLMTATIPNDLV
jgi:hypothetical protein